MLKFKKMCKTKSIMLQVFASYPYALYSTLSCKLPKQHTKSLKKDEIWNIRMLPNL